MFVFNRVPLNAVLTDPELLLRKITPKRKFEDGAYTDEIVGYVYDVVCLDNYEKLQIAVEQPTPVIAPHDLEAALDAGQKIFVEFDSAIVSYYARTEGAGDRMRPVICNSIKAAGVQLVKK